MQGEVKGTREKLENMSNENLIEVRKMLSSFEWPEALGEKPDYWDLLPDFRISTKDKFSMSKHDIIQLYMRETERIIKERFLLNEAYDLSGERFSPLNLSKNRPVIYETIQWLGLTVAVIAIIISILNLL